MTLLLLRETPTYPSVELQCKLSTVKPLNNPLEPLLLPFPSLLLLQSLPRRNQGEYPPEHLEGPVVDSVVNTRPVCLLVEVTFLMWINWRMMLL